jgi:hypothetical protein
VISPGAVVYFEVDVEVGIGIEVGSRDVGGTGVVVAGALVGEEGGRRRRRLRGRGVGTSGVVDRCFGASSDGSGREGGGGWFCSSSSGCYGLEREG